MMLYTMHRTQLLLDDGQYQTLKSLADAQGRSLSDLVREIVAAHLKGQPARAARRLSEIAGVAEGPPDGAAEHDHYLYGWPKGGLPAGAPPGPTTEAPPAPPKPQARRKSGARRP
jgi:hypothetical protein